MKITLKDYLNPISMFQEIRVSVWKEYEVFTGERSEMIDDFHKDYIVFHVSVLSDRLDIVIRKEG